MSDDVTARLVALEKKVDELTKELMTDRADSLRSRLEELEVRANLLAKNARDETAPMLEALRNGVLDARAMVEQARDSAGDGLKSASDRFGSAVDDLRGRLEEASQKIRPDRGDD